MSPTLGSKTPGADTRENGFICAGHMSQGEHTASDKQNSTLHGAGISFLSVVWKGSNGTPLLLIRKEIGKKQIIMQIAHLHPLRKICIIEIVGHIFQILSSPSNFALLSMYPCFPQQNQGGLHEY